jgi:MoaA/NifB/PqqE/SkfB family radical SAM enzyme
LAAFADHFYLQAMRVASMNDGLPLVTLYLTERCNSRCVTCDYWRHGRKDVTLEAVTRLLPDLRALRTRTALISGGEPLLNPQWREIAETLRSEGIDLWLLTSGLSLFKHARPAAGLFKTVTVSLDGTCAETYTAIRGLDAFDKVCDGIRGRERRRRGGRAANHAAAGKFSRASAIRDAGRELGASQVSFLAVDVSNPHAFARREDFSPELALRATEVEELDALVGDLERNHADDFRRRFIAESPAKMSAIRDYFAALSGMGPFPPCAVMLPSSPR